MIMVWIIAWLLVLVDLGFFVAYSVYWSEYLRRGPSAMIATAPYLAGALGMSAFVLSVVGVIAAPGRGPNTNQGAGFIQPRFLPTRLLFGINLTVILSLILLLP